MPENSENPSPRVELVRASPGQEPILANLLELYVHDFSEFYPVELGADGKFGYKDLEQYWKQPDRHPFLIRADGNLAGLVLVKRVSEAEEDGAVWDVAEFFVVRAYRRRGIGIDIAQQVWRRFPGPWTVRVMESNRNALNFWRRAIATFIGAAIDPVQIERDGGRWHVFEFESKLDLKP